MAFNSVLILEGYPTKTPEKISHNDTLFAAFTIATQDTYPDKEEQGKWHKRKAIFHYVATFKPKLIDMATELSTSDRIKVTAQLSYNNITAFDKDGKKIMVKQAQIKANKIEPAPLPNKQS